MAWLNATPKPDERSKRAKTAAGTISRRDKMKRDGITPRMPPNPAPHIITRLVEIGLTESNGMGATPLSWREIVAWQSATGVILSPWEARLIRSLSISYIAEGRRAEAEACPPPWRTALTAQERMAAEDALWAVLG